MEEEQDLLTLTEVAAMTRQSPSTLRFWRHVGTTGPKSFKVGRRVMYRRDDVQRWLDAQYAAEGGGGEAA